MNGIVWIKIFFFNIFVDLFGFYLFILGFNFYENKIIFWVIKVIYYLYFGRMYL